MIFQKDSFDKEEENADGTNKIHSPVSTFHLQEEDKVYEMQCVHRLGDNNCNCKIKYPSEIYDSYDESDIHENEISQKSHPLSTSFDLEKKIKQVIKDLNVFDSSNLNERKR